MYLFLGALLTGLGLGWLRGGSLERLGQWPLRLAWLLPLALAWEAGIVMVVGREAPSWVLPVHVGANLMLLAVVVANRRLPGLAVIGVGVLMNATVIALNGGLMPQAPETLYVKHRHQDVAIGQHAPQTKDVVLPHDQAHLWWLGDVLPTPPWSPKQTVVSPGDVVVAAGLAWTVMAMMRPGVARRRPVRSTRAVRPMRAMTAMRTVHQI